MKTEKEIKDKIKQFETAMKEDFHKDTLEWQWSRSSRETLLWVMEMEIYGH